MTGPEELRRIVSNLNDTDEDFNMRFTAEELIKIGRALLTSGWDIYPDEWTEGQVQDALRGIAPRWEERDGRLVPIARDPEPRGGA